MVAVHHIACNDFEPYCKSVGVCVRVWFGSGIGPPAACIGRGIVPLLPPLSTGSCTTAERVGNCGDCHRVQSVLAVALCCGRGSAAAARKSFSDIATFGRAVGMNVAKVPAGEA